MPRKEIPITVSNYIKVDGIDHRKDEYSVKNFEKMFAEMEERTLLRLGYEPVKTA